MKLERAAAIAADLAYVLLIAAMLFLLVPQAREAAKRLAAGAIWHYQLGHYVMSRRATPAWVRTAAATPAEELPGE